MSVSRGSASFTVTHHRQPSLKHDRPPVLELVKVGLEIPISTTETRSLKKSLLRSVTGGHLRKRGSGAVVTLRGITSTFTRWSRCPHHLLEPESRLLAARI